MNFEIISLFGIMVLFASLFTTLELFLIYFSPPKKIEIDNGSSTVPLKIYTNYFLLPFRTKVTEYRTLKNVELSVNRDMVSAKKHNIYELVLRLPGKEILLKKGNKKELLKECETIVQSMNSSKKYVLTNNTSFNTGIVVCFFAFILFMIFVKSGSEITMINDKYAEAIIVSYMIATVAFFMFVVSSIILNYSDNNNNDTKKDKINSLESDEELNDRSVKESNDIGATAQKIYDSLIR